VLCCALERVRMRDAIARAQPLTSPALRAPLATHREVCVRACGPAAAT